jgi:hypothetical protein
VEAPASSPTTSRSSATGGVDGATDGVAVAPGAVVVVVVVVDVVVELVVLDVAAVGAVVVDGVGAALTAPAPLATKPTAATTATRSSGMRRNARLGMEVRG